MLRRQRVVLSGVVYYQRVEHQTGCFGNRGGGPGASRTIA